MASHVNEHFKYAKGRVTDSTIVNGLRVGEMVQDFKVEFNKPDSKLIVQLFGYGTLSSYKSTEKWLL